MTARCFAPTRFEGPAGARTLDDIAACRADVGRLPDEPALQRDATWLFCACAAPLAALVADDWVPSVQLSALGLTAAFGLLLLLLCCACRDAAKAKKRRKQHKLELAQLKAAERDAAAGGAGEGAAADHGLV